jgi:hypothetical protein
MKWWRWISKAMMGKFSSGRPKQHFARLLLMVMVLPLVGAPPPLREEVSLAGEWTQGGRVPHYGGSRTPLDHLTCARTVLVPEHFRGKEIRLEFAAVNFACDVYVNHRLAGRHVGAWIPFAVDITSLVEPGRPFDLRVEIEGMRGPRTVGADGWERWPVGSQQLDGRWTGIADDVWLRAYGRISIRDAFPQPSVRERRLRVVYTLHNATAEPQDLEVHPAAHRWEPAGGTNAGPVEKSWSPLKVRLGAGETRTVTGDLAWPEARCWTPDTPHLYVLVSRLLRQGQVVDWEQRRFGFREFNVAGDKFALNGVPTTLRGDYLGYGGYIPAEMQTPEGLPETYRFLKQELGMNALRWHMRPAPGYCYELADEIGLLIVCESAVYGRPDPRHPMPATVKAEYLANVHRWIPAWIQSRRHHPSIVQWSVVNEMGPKYKNHQGLSVAELKAAGAVARAHDPTRPIVYHGNAEVRDEDIVSYHYPGLAPDQPDAGLYAWRRLLVAGKPVAVGEYFQTSVTAPGMGDTPEARRARAENTKDWLGLWNRGLRYLGIADFRPKTLAWVRTEPAGSWRVEVLKNSNLAVALYDRDYDELGIAPLRPGGKLPVLPAGAKVPRRLVLFNEDWSGDRVEWEIEVRREGQVLSRRGGRLTLAPGYRHEWTEQLEMPGTPGPVEVVRRVVKEGQQRLKESRRFMVQ